MRIIKKIIILFKVLFNFGIKLFFLNIFKFLFKNNKYLFNYFNNKKHNQILYILQRKYNYLIIKYNKLFNDSYQDKPLISDIIWICWWDGIENMPPIVKACYNSVNKYSQGFKVNLITKNNLSDYITLPEHIDKKVKNKNISITHLSDIIRALLIKKYGGLWLDATVLVTDNINMDYPYLFTIRREYGGDNVSKRRWAGNCIAGSVNNPLFEFLSEFFSEYWKNNNFLIDYFLIDYAIMLAFNNIPLINKMINDIGNNNIEYLTFNENLHKEFSMDLYRKTICNTKFHKLYWRFKNNKFSDNKLTLYNYILQHF